VVRLVDDEHVGDLEDAGLRRLDPVAHAGGEGDDRGVRRGATSTSDCPTPTVSTMTSSNPAASRTSTACGVANDRPPRWPRDAIERMNTSGSAWWPCMRTRSPSSAPPENGDDGSTARIRDGPSAGTELRRDRVGEGRLPHPRRARDPEDPRPAGARVQRGDDLAQLGRRPVLGHGEQARERAPLTAVETGEESADLDHAHLS
jgi:hypothetical protein